MVPRVVSEFALHFERTRDSLTAVVHKFVVTNLLNLGDHDSRLMLHQ